MGDKSKKTRNRLIAFAVVIALIVACSVAANRAKNANDKEAMVPGAGYQTQQVA